LNIYLGNIAITCLFIDYELLKVMNEGVRLLNGLVTRNQKER